MTVSFHVSYFSGYCQLKEIREISRLHILSVKVMTSYPGTLPSATLHDLGPQGTEILLQIKGCKGWDSLSGKEGLSCFAVW